MDKRVVRERMRRKQRQLRMRQIMRLVTYLVVFVVAVIFVVRGVIFPVLNRFGDRKSGGTAEEVQAQPVSANPDSAIRQPLKGQADLAKVTQMTPGWHDDENGRWYRNTDGTFYSSGFQEIDGVLYCFDDHGYMETGWITRNYIDYYFNEDGSYNPDKKRPMLALTYDDGPGQYTQTLLDCLEENNAHATFFMLGQNVEYYPDAPKRMLEIGCEVGSHSWDHQDLTTLSLDSVASEYSDTDNALIEACGQAASVARAPYGSWSQDIIDTVGKPFFTWSLDSLDWSYKDINLDYDSVMNGDLSDGTIILMHDIHEASVEASLKIIPDLIEKGYKLVTVSEMAAAKGVNLQPASYSDFWQSSLNEGRVAGYDPDAAVGLDSFGSGSPSGTDENEEDGFSEGDAEEEEEFTDGDSGEEEEFTDGDSSSE